MNIKTLIDRTSELLRDAGIAEPRREAMSFLAFALGTNRTFLFAHPEDEPDASVIAAFHALIARRSKREPFHYITGEREFFGRDFFVESGILIPRPETELLVEASIEFLRSRGAPRFFEIGVGSGCVSVSILKEVPDSSAVAVDVSETALRVASSNARRHLVADRLNIRHGGLFTGIDEKFDLVVSNPPYVPDADLPTLQPEVANFEPHTALFAGTDGLDLVRRIIRDGQDHLLPGGVLLMEIGFGQADAVESLLNNFGWSNIEFVEDLQRIPRIVKASLPGPRFIS